MRNLINCAFVAMLICLFSACSKSEQQSSAGEIENNAVPTLEHAIRIPSSSNVSENRTIRPLVVKVFIDAIGDYFVAVGKDVPQPIQPEALDGYLAGIQAMDSTITLAIYADADVSHKYVFDVYYIADKRHIPVFEVSKKDQEEMEEVSEPTPTRSEPSSKPTQYVSEPAGPVPAISQKQIEDSIAIAQREAKERVNAVFNGVSFPTDEESNTPSRKGKSYSGSGSVGGYKWSMTGRDAISIPSPKGSFNEEGNVIVRVRVNATGEVIEAGCIGGTISDRQTIQLALDAALKAKFTAANGTQVGTITYTFKFQ